MELYRIRFKMIFSQSVKSTQDNVNTYGYAISYKNHRFKAENQNTQTK